MKCLICGKELPVGRQRFCSKQCFDRARALEKDHGEDLDWEDLAGTAKPEPPAPLKLKGIKAKLPLFATSDQEKLSNLAFTAAGIIALSTLVIFYFIHTVHEGPYLLMEKPISAVHIVYAGLLVAIGIGLRSFHTANLIKPFLVVAGFMLALDIWYVSAQRISLAIIPILVNLYILYSAWLLLNKKYDQ